MAFSIKQLLFCIAVVAFGLVALFSGQPFLGILFDALTLGVLIAMAYNAWLSQGEVCAFRVGFVCWGVLYFLLFKKVLNLPIHHLISALYQQFHPMTIGPSFIGLHPNFNSVSQSLLLLLTGLIGGWVTVFVYRKRERSIASGR